MHSKLYQTAQIELLLLLLLFSLPPSQQIQQEHHQNSQQQQQQQQLHTLATTNNTITNEQHNNKKLSFDIQNQSLNKLQRYLSQRQLDLIKRNPGSLLAIARALKMSIVECQYQMRHEPWDCPIYGFSIHPADVFGKLMSRSFKETSFIHSLLSSAIAHSVARACTESTITTCQKRNTRDRGWSENYDFGMEFAHEFMDATHEVVASTGSSPSAASSSSSSGSIDKNHINNNIIAVGSGAGSGDMDALPTTGGFMMEPTKRDRRIRIMINRHNDEVGRLHIYNGMRRECKCHGLSGACNYQTCWLKLPPFREVASKLHDSLDQAIRVIYVNQNPNNRQKSLTSTAVKKSNKKRSSTHPVNSLTRSSISSNSPSLSSNQNSNSHTYPYTSSNLLTSETASIIGSRVRGAKRHTSPDDCEDCYSSSNLSGGAARVKAPEAAGGTGGGNDGDQPIRGDNQPVQTMRAGNTTVVKKRPVARSIGIDASTIEPTKLDLLYYEESPDFCNPSERYNIKGTKGRICSESSNAINNCERLCCGRGYKTEVREEKYKCDCLFEFCCKLNCNTCTRRKVIHKCL